MKSKFIVAVISFFLCQVVLAQVKFEAEVSRETIGVNERVRIDFKMNQDGDNFNPPDFRGFKVVGGPYQSISNSWINGKRTYQKSYGYYLQPNGRGDFTIGQAEILIAGTTYKTTPIEIKVVAAVNKPTDGTNAEIVASQNIHLVTKISNENPYLNEGISVEYILYVSPNINVSQWRPVDSPKFPDFWSENIDVSRLDVKDGTYQGEPYRYVSLRKTILYPQKTGELSLEPLTLSVSVEVPSDRRDIFGRRLFETVQQRVSASAKTIKVKPLPQQGKPAGFTGAVGSFNFSVTTNKQSLDASESLEAKVKVSGNGNLMLFQLPKLTLPASLEVYEPEHNQDTRTGHNGVVGSITDTYTIVPQQKGKYPIEPVSFSYFDVKSGSYKVLSSKELMIDVENGPMASIPSNSGSASSNKQEVISTGSQFRYLKLQPNLKPMGEERFFKSLWFWLLILLPLLAIPLSIIFGKKRKERLNDVAGKQVKKADKLARKYLSEAKKNIGDPNAFYLALEKSLHNFLRAKLSIQTSEMSKDRIRTILTEKQIDSGTTDDFIQLLKNCEMARYSLSSQAAMEQDYGQAAQVLSLIDKDL
ncbi:BatD family protein [Mesonia sp. MT50]|uniref:BatD family protein n=1 Tax=Mesonia profundi TaxID=3070998 RepID=A0ABU1A1K9_9FLAO|nr:BatD family protein [Mesonia profundi]MDQ7917136.1 BatD family protein [Mesonia profundi]